MCRLFHYQLLIYWEETLGAWALVFVLVTWSLIKICGEGTEWPPVKLSMQTILENLGLFAQIIKGVCVYSFTIYPAFM